MKNNNYNNYNNYRNYNFYNGYNGYSGYNYGRANRMRVKKIKMRRRMIALAVAASLGFGGFAISKAISDKNKGNIIYPTIDSTVSVDYNPVDVEQVPVDEYYEEPVIEEVIPESPVVQESYQEPTYAEQVPSYANGFNRGDSVIATTDVNLRLDADKSSFKMGVLPEGSVVNRILTDGEWDLVRYGDQISYVHSDYTRENDIDYNQDYYHVEEYNDIVRTTSKLYFRLGPSKSEKDMFLLDKGEELVVIGKSVSNDDPNDIWYLVRARGQIGFVKAEYTKSLKNILSSVDPSISNVEIQKVGYFREDTTMYDANREPSGSIEKYQLAQVLQENGDYYLVNVDGQIGYVKKKAVKAVSGSFVAVDISSQRITLYCDNDIAFQGRCTTGKKSSPTELGFFTPYGKGSSHNFGPSHNNVEAHILWMPFNGGQGLHDAPWEADKYFGDYSYAMKHGSAGCVRLPDDVASFIYQNTKKSTPILVKK